MRQLSSHSKKWGSGPPFPLKWRLCRSRSQSTAKKLKKEYSALAIPVFTILQNITYKWIVHNRPNHWYTVSYWCQFVAICLSASFTQYTVTHNHISSRVAVRLQPGVRVWGFLSAGVRVEIPIFKTLASEGVGVPQKWGLHVPICKSKFMVKVDIAASMRAFSIILKVC